MRKTILSVTASVALAIAANMPLSAWADDVMISGEVTKVNESAGKITIKHGPIKKFDMDAMTMVFQAQDPTVLKQLKAGDRITFHPDKVNGQLTVTKLEKAK